MGLKPRWVRRRPSDDEMREEIEWHVAMRAEHDGAGEAAARRRLGNMLQTRERMRGVWIAEWWDALWQDAHFTWRSWLRQPGFAVGAIAVLALGLGASTALFAALDRVLFRPLPYVDPERLVSVGQVTVPLVYERQTETLSDEFYVREWAAPPAPFESVTTILGSPGPCPIADDQPEDLRCLRVEHNLLRVLGVRVALGRDFAPEDDLRGAPAVALISHALWIRRFGADPGAVGRTLRLDVAGALLAAPSLLQARIIGVLPAGFEAPFDIADILLPAQMRPVDATDRQIASYSVLARLRAGVTPERAAQMLASGWPEGMRPLFPGFREEWRVRPLHERRVGEAARAAWLLVGAVAIFLLIACVNVTNLMLARVGERRREFALRAAIGAGRARLARLALAESLLLALAAGGIGLAVAFALLETFVGMAPAGMRGVADASIDLRVFVVAALLVVITGTAVGVWPAVSVFRAGALGGLRSTTPSSAAARPRLRFALVTTQIALTLALLGGSALLLRSLSNVVNTPLGFDADRVVTLTATLSRVRYPTAESSAAFFEELLARARAMPGVVSVAMSNAPPPPLLSSARAPVEAEGRPAEAKALPPAVRFRSVTPHYFETFRIPVVRGRTFQDADLAGAPAVVLNESAARTIFAGERELGRRIRFARLPAVSPIPGFTIRNPWYTVVGVTADVRNADAITDAPNPEIYLLTPPGRWVAHLPTAPGGSLALRTTASPAAAAAYLRQVVSDLDSQQLVTIQTGEEILMTATAQPRFVTSLLTAFAVLALLLAAAGLYSVASYLLLQRRRDIGVRVAIGASPRAAAGALVGEAGRWVVGGALIGCALGWSGTRALESQLYGVDALDPWAWTAALTALSLVLVTAVFRPAYRAAHMDPVAALRSD